jgi:hypothetical protein
MDWLIRNSIADIHGPAFLVLYFEVAAVTIALACVVVCLCEETRLHEPPPVQSTFDPFEFAHLWGGKMRSSAPRSIRSFNLVW